MKRKSKFDSKAALGVPSGYTDAGCRVLVSNKVIIARHVDIIEKNIKCIDFISKEDIEKEIIKYKTRQLIGFDNKAESMEKSEEKRM